ncbi:hypothetical protein HZS61_015354 [Fusarium oxysporum f. sp. conglutinans]|uniref:Uncharacterized protein n=1 Tax=Fusarium oxysporum f. sp. conglutinans TaxID=100902 RepID=A0A8H6GPI0_FUSOX|nr:hypothetical protein HZS61_015354 [Fusarium oxysporum f. sp. conglutinans]
MKRGQGHLAELFHHQAQVLVLCHSILSFKLHWFYPTMIKTILKSSLHLLSHGLDHSLGFTIKTFSKSSIVDGVDSRHVLPLMTNLPSDKL